METAIVFQRYDKKRNQGIRKKSQHVNLEIDHFDTTTPLAGKKPSPQVLVRACDSPSSPHHNRVLQASAFHSNHTMPSNDAEKSEDVIFYLRKRKDIASYSGTKNRDMTWQKQTANQATRSESPSPQRDLGSSSESGDETSGGSDPSRRSVNPSFSAPRLNRLRSLTFESTSDPILIKLKSKLPETCEGRKTTQTTPRRCDRKRYAIPLRSFSDDGLRLLLQMHAELREVTTLAERERHVNERQHLRNQWRQNSLMKQTHRNLKLVLDSACIPKANAAEEDRKPTAEPQAEPSSIVSSRVEIGEASSVLIRAMLEDWSEGQAASKERFRKSQGNQTGRKGRVRTRVRLALQSLGFRCTPK